MHRDALSHEGRGRIYKHRARDQSALAARWSTLSAVFNDRFHPLMLANFKNRGAATFFKDITTIGALLILAVHARKFDRRVG